MRYETNFLTSAKVRKALRAASTRSVLFIRREARATKERKGSRYYISIINHGHPINAGLLTFCEKNYGAGLTLTELRTLAATECARRRAAR